MQPRVATLGWSDTPPADSRLALALPAQRPELRLVVLRLGGKGSSGETGCLTPPGAV